MSIGYERDLYILAMDHRTSFERMLGISGCPPTRNESKRIEEAKYAIWKGFRRALELGAPRDAAGVLVDTHYGERVAREAREQGAILAMPVDKSGEREFDFEYGELFAERIEEFDPTFAKVLVRYNPEGDGALNRRQSERLKRLSDWAHGHDRKFMFELLVPAEPHQLNSVEGDPERYDEELRPRLMMQAIEELRHFDVEPDVWKIEGILDREACRRIAELVRSDGRDSVSCIVLGRGASQEKVDAWLRAGAGLPGYVGFAIGRSIFAEALQALTDDGDQTPAIEMVARTYLRFIAVYRSAAVPA